MKNFSGNVKGFNTIGKEIFWKNQIEIYKKYRERWFEILYRLVDLLYAFILLDSYEIKNRKIESNLKM